MQSKATLLLVDDNRELTEGLKDVLNFEGYTVLVAHSGREGLERMRVVTPDLIVSDISMPEMDGFEFFDQVHSRPEWVTIPFIFLSAHGEPENVLRVRNLGAEDFLVKPVSPLEVIAAVQSRLARFHQLRAAQLEQAYQASLTVLANAIELRDQYTRGHVERVTEYSVTIAERLGLSGKRLDQLRLGAILHDIGKILVDSSIWLKAAPLTEAERQEIHQHTVRGADMIQGITYLEPAINAIRYHHERWDGKGYPQGLAADQIPLEARVISVADSFDAMTTTRQYHKAISLEQACQEIAQSSGSLYDPQVVSAFLRTWENGSIQDIARKWQQPS